MTGIEVVGIKHTIRKVRRRGKENKAKLKIGMGKAGRFLLSRSQKVVPIDTGALKRSGNSRVFNNSEDNPIFHVTYGNTSVDYALVVHENLDAFHIVGQAKYLEQPAREYRLTLIHIVESQFK